MRPWMMSVGVYARTLAAGYLAFPSLTPCQPYGPDAPVQIDMHDRPGKPTAPERTRRFLRVIRITLLLAEAHYGDVAL